MFYPLCKTEYREGFDTCADCSVPLVAELPQKEDQSETSQTEINLEEGASYSGELVEVFQTLDQSEVLIIKSVLDEEGIPYHFSGDFFRMSGIFISPARLLVPADSKDRVLEIFKELEIEA